MAAAPSFSISPTHLGGVIEMATPDELERGRTWYPTEEAWVRSTAYCYETTPEKVAAITAILSSNAPWDVTGVLHAKQHTNKMSVITTLQALVDDPDTLSEVTLFATQRQRLKCKEVYATPDFRLTPALGPKCFPFACNLLGDYDQFTLDQMGWTAVIGWIGVLRQHPAITKRRREQAEVAYFSLAERLGVPIAIAQSMIWVPWRRIRKELLHGQRND